jgi:putative ABC transport system ATP-binding protein
LKVPLIQFCGVSRSYGRGEAEVRALDGVDLSIARGEFVAIMGPSGSGKSTAMNIIGCLDRPTAGTYLFQGVEVQDLDQDRRALLRRHCLGFVFQGFNLLARQSALENVELPLIYKGLPKAQRVARARLALQKVGLQGREGHDPSQLSGGQQQRVAIARALASDPMVILADEPTGNLDSQRSHEIMQLLQGLNRDGITIVMVTHEQDIAAYAQRLLVFTDGKLSHDAATPTPVVRSA